VLPLEERQFVVPVTAVVRLFYGLWAPSGTDLDARLQKGSSSPTIFILRGAEDGMTDFF